MGNLRAILPKRLFVFFKKIQGFHFSFFYFYRKSFDLIKHTPIGAVNSKDFECSRIVGTYHVIEKGLTMPNPRAGFGKDRILELIDLVNSYIKLESYNARVVQESCSIIHEYISFNEKMGYSLDNRIISSYEKFIENNPSINKKSTQRVSTNSDYSSFSKSEFCLFSQSRHSVRNLSNEVVDIAVIRRIVELANNAPSACNRQGSRVHYYSDSKKIREILELQGGARGFSDKGGGLFILTNEASVWSDVKSVTGSYVDGGIFGMNLLYAIHYHELGSCPLNCFFDHKKETLIKKIAKIPKSQNLIMMILVGHLPEVFSSANSTRILEVNDILTIEN